MIIISFIQLESDVSEESLLRQQVSVQIQLILLTFKSANLSLPSAGWYSKGIATVAAKVTKDEV